MGTSYHLLRLCLLLAICLHFTYQATAAEAAKCRPEYQSALFSLRKTFVDRPRGEDEECYPYLWDVDVDCCLWNGIKCDSSTGAVVSVTLSEICATATSATFSSNSTLFQVSSIQYLEISHSDLALSTIPNEIGRLTQLRVLYLRNSRLTGPIPDAVGNLTQLRTLFLKMNDLSGGIPPVLAKLPLLEWLDLSGCALTGSIPGGLFSHPHMETLTLEYNELSGSLPSTISGTSSLLWLELGHNRLEGPIPSWLFQIPSLELLSLDHNNLGPLHTFRKPKESSLSHVDLSHNKINGPLTPLLQLANVIWLDLRATQLTGVVEWNGFKNMVGLTFLYLSGNRGLTMKNSEGAPVNLQSLRIMEIASCSVTEFPSYLSGLKDLWFLNVSDNKIGGAVFKESGWEALRWFYGSHNQITAFEFPNRIIGVFDLSNNRLKGPLPKLNASKYILQLNLSNNMLGGGIPVEYCMSLDELDLSYNNLDGELPSCLILNKELNILHLQNNRFHGVISPTFVNGSFLSSLDLSRNQLRGRIPPSLMKLESLQYLNLSYNKLNGPIPPGKFPSTSYVGNPGLCGPPLSTSC